jgi:putative MFS transporter
VANLSKFIGPAGLALIAGSSNLVSPKATLDAMIPGFNFLASWYVLGAFAFWFIGFETRRRSLDEIDRALSGGPLVAAGAVERTAGD